MQQSFENARARTVGEQEDIFCVCGGGCACKAACEYLELALTSDGYQQECACRCKRNRKDSRAGDEYQSESHFRGSPFESTYADRQQQPQQEYTRSFGGHLMTARAPYEGVGHAQRPSRGRSNTDNSDLAYVPTKVEGRRGEKDPMPLNFYGDGSRYPAFRQTMPDQPSTLSQFSTSPPATTTAGRPQLYHAQTAALPVQHDQDTNAQLLFGNSPALPRPQMLPRFVSAGGNKRLSQRSVLDFDLPNAEHIGFEMSKDELFKNLPPETFTPRPSLEKTNDQMPRSRSGSTAVKQALKRVFSRSSSSAQE